jgi:hypothetical protein
MSRKSALKSTMTLRGRVFVPKFRTRMRSWSEPDSTRKRWIDTFSFR